MKKRKVSIRGLIILCSALFLASCEKQEEKNEVLAVKTTTADLKATNEINVDTLRIFLAKISGVQTDSISYDENEKFFIWRNKKQISLEGLTEAYQQNLSK